MKRTNIRSVGFVLMLLVVVIIFDKGYSHAQSLVEKSPVSYALSYPQLDLKTEKSDLIFKKREFKSVGEVLEVIISDNKSVPTEIHEGALSPNKNFVAYTVKSSSSWGIEPFIYIYDINARKISKEIPIKDNSTDRFVTSWSKDAKYLLLVSKAQSIGDIKGEIYEVSSKKELKKINMYDHQHEWGDDNEFIYTYPKKTCQEACFLEMFEVKKVDLKSGKETKLMDFSIEKGELPYLKKFNKKTSRKIELEVRSELTYLNSQFLEFNY